MEISFFGVLRWGPLSPFFSPCQPVNTERLPDMLRPTFFSEYAKLARPAGLEPATF